MRMSKIPKDVLKKILKEETSNVGDNNEISIKDIPWGKHKIQLLNDDALEYLHTHFSLSK